MNATEKRLRRTSTWAYVYALIGILVIIVLTCDCGETINAFATQKRVSLFLLMIVSVIYFYLSGIHYPKKI